MPLGCLHAVVPQEITCRLNATLVAGVVGRLRAQVVEVESLDVGRHCRVRFSREGARVVGGAKLDRLGRDAMDIGATIKLLAARRIEMIVLQLGKLDLGSAAGRMILTVFAAMAEMERDLLVERTQSGLVRAKAEGRVLGRPARTTAGDRAKIVALHTTGLSLAVIAVQFRIGKATVHAIVKAARTAAQAPAPTTAAKPAKAIRKATAAA